ncbi:MAG TPA: anti-sigma factor [Bryobacteraceae bacterium]|nr:anti-sigma factor [Bryobacteraceae bacterium]
MNCSPDLLEAYLDEELDAAQHTAVEEHLASCVACSDRYARLQRQKESIRRAAPYYGAPPQLRQSIRAGLRARQGEATAPRREAYWRWAAIAASILLVASVAWNIVQLRPRPGEDRVAENIFADHIRSLIGTHLMDVVSTDQHTVKPWFAGKLDFSPVVKDFSAEGFPLAGGRIEYISGRRVAALVYYRRKHVINVFTWPAAGEAGRTRGNEALITQNGYNLLHWTDGSMTYWAVSDVSATDLKTLRNLL